MAQFSDPFPRVRVAAPCSADWERMTGDEQVRFCSQCETNVYNLSQMTKREAEALIVKKEGRLCVRFYRRSDGSILTKNCPVGLGAIRRRASRIVNAVASALIGFFAGLGVYGGFRQASPATPYGLESPTMGTMAHDVPLNLPSAVLGEAVMGDIVTENWTSGQLEMGKVAPLPRSSARR